MNDLLFVKAVYLCRELSAGIERYCTEKTIENVKRVLENGTNELSQKLSIEVEDGSSSSASQVARLVLKDFDVAEHEFKHKPTQSGKDALEYLQNLLFPGSAASLTFPSSVFMSTLHKATLAANVCIAALVDAITPENCISLFSLARSCGCETLLEGAKQVTLQNFSTASVEDYEGLVALNEEELLELLSSDELNVDTELDVFKAAASWVEHDLPNRIVNFARRMAISLRFSQLTLADMTYIMDQHPLVSLDREAIELVTYAILQTYMNTNFENGLGHLSITKPRNCQLADASSAAVAPPTPKLTFEDIITASLRDDVEEEAMKPQPMETTKSVQPAMDVSQRKVLGDVNSTAGVAVEMLVSPGKRPNEQRWGAEHVCDDDTQQQLESRRKLSW